MDMMLTVANLVMAAALLMIFEQLLDIKQSLRQIVELKQNKS